MDRETAENESSPELSFLGFDFLQNLVALTLLALSTVGAGLLLATEASQLEKLPGLLLMIPAAIALRGNIFGALGSRLGTAIHSGTYKFSFSRNSVMGENVIASLALTLSTSFMLAILAKATAIAFGISDSISIDRFIVISLLGGLLASSVVLFVALSLAALSVRYNWNPDNVTAPLVTAAGDLLTVPALIWSATLVDSDRVSLALSIVFACLTLVSIVVWWKSKPAIQVILRESTPVLIVALLLDLLAGYSIESQRSDFVNLPSLLVLLPSYLALAGALGGTLSSRLATKLHLGLIQPLGFPTKTARRDVTGMVLVSVPAFAIVALLTLGGASLFDLGGPSSVNLVGVALLGGVIATCVVSFTAYYGTMASVRLGVDPDTYGITMVTSVVDLMGALSLTLAIGILHIF